MRSKVITKQDIIEVAEKVIEFDGINKCSMRRISKELNVAVGTVYNYYESRDEMFLDVFRDSWQKTFDRIKQIETGLEPIDRIMAIYDTIMDGIKSRNGLGRKIYESGQKVDFSRGVQLIRGSIVEAIRMSLNNEAEEERDVTANWVFAVLFDSIERGAVIGEYEKELISKMLA